MDDSLKLLYFLIFGLIVLWVLKGVEYETYSTPRPDEYFTPSDSTTVPQSSPEER